MLEHVKSPAPKTISGVRTANLRLVIECRRCSHLVAYYQTQLHRLLDRIKDMSLADLERRAVCGICCGRNPLISARLHDERVRTIGLHESR